MPYAALTSCSHPRCGVLCPGRFCDDHRKETQNQYNRARRSDPIRADNDQFYSRKRWRDARADQLRREPLCCVCRQDGRIVAGNIVDHITPRSQGGSDYDAANLQTLCESHHNAKTRREQNSR